MLHNYSGNKCHVWGFVNLTPMWTDKCDVPTQKYRLFSFLYRKGKSLYTDIIIPVLRGGRAEINSTGLVTAIGLRCAAKSSSCWSHLQSTANVQTLFSAGCTEEHTVLTQALHIRLVASMLTPSAPSRGPQLMVNPSSALQSTRKELNIHQALTCTYTRVTTDCQQLPGQSHSPWGSQTVSKWVAITVYPLEAVHKQVPAHA